MAAAGVHHYIHEPLNLDRVPRWRRHEVSNWYQHLPEDSPLWDDVDRVVALRSPLTSNLRRSTSARQAASALKQAASASMGRAKGRACLIKDPFMLFNAEAFRNRYAAQVVLSVREPVSFVSSLKRLTWAFDFQNLANQRDLLHGPLEPWSEEIRAASRRPLPFIEQASLLWRLLHGHIWNLSQTNPDFVIVLHEEIATAPEKQVPELYSRLDLPLSPRARSRIRLLTQGANEDSRRGVNSVMRNSAEQLNNWRQGLTLEEAERVNRITSAERTLFYSEQ